MASRIRQYRLDESRDRVLRLAHLRPPQRQSFDSVHKLCSDLDDDLALLPQPALVAHLAHKGFDVTAPPPQFLFSLATGVGKTRLMGSLIAYLFNAGQTRNCLILSSRAAVLEKLEREIQIGHPKYLLLDSGLIANPHLCFRSNMGSFKPALDRLNLFVLSPQSITGTDRRFARDSEFRGFSLLEYLRGLNDLIVFVDEAHHLGAAVGDERAGWMEAVRDLKPRLYFGLTATPRSDPGINILHTYDLGTCLREGHYTKAADLIVEQRDESISDQDWDRSTIDFALRRLEIKRTAIQEYSRAVATFPNVEPVLLICAKDTDHAEEIASWLKTGRGFSDAEILVTHSERTKTEEDIRRLVSIDHPSNRVRIVVNVFQLTEGWDVTNVYVIAPLRAMATFQGAVQTMGRGLRLPSGVRTGMEEIDTLDVLCCGRESFEDILREATEQFGKGDDVGGLDVTRKLDLQYEEPIPKKDANVKKVRDVEIPVGIVVGEYGEPPLDFAIESLGSLTKGGATALHLHSLERTGLDEGVGYQISDFVTAVHARVIAELRYLSEPLHGEALDQLIKRFLLALGAEPGRPIVTDPARVAILVAEEIDRRYRGQSVRFRVTGTRSITVADYTCRVPATATIPAERVAVEDWR